MHYRPEIDGLRTIAVGAVIIYHAELYIAGQHVLKGGFLGVDIFFVISGYLITTLIHEEFTKTGRFSVWRFYERRARRLLPALLVVILASIPFAWAILLPFQLIDYAWSLVTSLFFVSNFYWDQTLQQYGAEAALLKPFVHTWSLAVEEQYYLFAPLILVSLYAFAPRMILLGLTALIVISLGIAEATNDIGSFAFFMLPARLWELMVGAFVAHTIVHRDSLPLSPGLRGLIVASAMAALLISVVIFPLGDHHPGLLTVAPVLATAAIIFFATPRDPVGKVLATRPFVAIGLISYSLYLWHYPVFAFGLHLDARPDLFIKAIWIALTVILSVVTYFLVERPFRDRKIIKLRPAIVTFASLAVVTLGTSAVVVAGGGLRERFPDLVALYAGDEFDNQILRERSTEMLVQVRREGFFHDPAKIRMLFVGNSHSKDLWNAYYLHKELYPDVEFGRYLIQTGAPDAEVSKLLAHPDMQAADVVIISSAYQESRNDVSRLPGFINAIQSLGKTVVLTSNNERFQRSGGGKTLFDRLVMSGKRSLEEIWATYFEARVDLVDLNERLRAIAEEAGILFTSKSDVVCSYGEQICYGSTPAGLKTYFDQGHWTLEGARFFGQRIYEQCWIDIPGLCRQTLADL